MRAAFAVPTGGGRDSAHSSSAAGESHVFTSSLFSGSSASPARRPMDLLRGRAGASNPQVAPTTRDQALADHQLQTLVRTKGASILRQRLLFLLRKQFEKEFDEIDDFFANGGTLATPAAPTGKHAKTSSSSSKQQQQQQASGEAGDDTLPQALRILHQVEDLLISCDNSDVENAGYLRDYAKKVNRPEKKPATKSSKRSATKGNSDDEDMDEDEEDDFLDDDDEDFDDDGILGGGGTSSKKRRDQPIIGAAIGGGAMMATPSFILQASSFSSSVNLTAAAGAAAPQTGNSAAHPAAGTPLVSRPATGGDSRFGIASTTVVSDSECSSTDDVISPSKETRGAANSSSKPSAATTAGKAGTTSSSTTTPSAKDSSSGTSNKKDGGSEWSAGALDRDYSGVKPTNEFYAIRVKRTPGTGSVACPKCLRDLSDLPSNLPTQVVVADACTNTAERSDSEKDFLVASLTKAKQDAEKKMEEIRKELVAFKKMKYANSNFATPNGAAAGTPSSSPNGKLVSNQSFSLGDGAMDCTGPLSPVRAASAMGMMDEGPPLPPVRASSSMGFGAAPTSNAWANTNSSSNASSSSQSAASQRVGKDSRTTTTTTTGSKRASSGAVRRGGGGGEVPNPAQSTPPDTPPPPPVFQQQQSDAQQPPPSHHHHTNRKPLPIQELQRMNNALKDLRAKLQGIRAGVKSFQFREVFQQFSQHVIPQAQLLQSANRRLLDRDYILEKLLLDALCKIGTMPDAGSPEGYLPDGGPLHVGTYSLLDDRRFLEWTRRIGDTLTAKVSAVQGYLQTLSTEVRTLQSGSNSSSSSGSSGAARGDGGGGGSSDTTITLNRKEQLLLEDRVQLLESSLVEHECFNVSNTLDHTFDSSSAVQSSRRAEFVTLLKQAAETNEEIRLVYVVPGWCAKPPLRVKMNMWRQRRLESLQKVEQVLSQEMQHYVSTGAQKVVLKGKLMTLRELIQLASKIMVMPPSANVFGAGHALAQRDAGGGGGAATAGATWKMISSPPAVVPLTPPSDLLPASNNTAGTAASSSASARSEGEHSSSSVSYEAPSAGSLQAAPASLPLNGGMLPSSSATTVAGSPTRLYGGGGVSDALRMSGSFSGLSLSNSQQAQPASSTSSSVVLSPTSAAAHNEKLAAAILNSKDPLRLRSPPTISSSASPSGVGGSASTGANSSSSTKRSQGSSRLPPMKN